MLLPRLSVQPLCCGFKHELRYLYIFIYDLVLLGCLRQLFCLKSYFKLHSVNIIIYGINSLFYMNCCGVWTASFTDIRHGARAIYFNTYVVLTDKVSFGS